MRGKHFTTDDDGSFYLSAREEGSGWLRRKRKWTGGRRGQIMIIVSDSRLITSSLSNVIFLNQP